jgi:aryl-alcohol dehydrogenase-like predicted oxidoreductase
VPTPRSPQLGRTGVSVSKLCLGTMMFGAWGNPDHDDSIRIIDAALDAGINFLDTADVYAAGESEEIVAKALAGGRRDDVVLATKVGFPMGDDPNRRGASHRRIIKGVEDSLRRLDTDWIDLYQIHRPDPSTDIDETLGALTDLVQQGQGPLHRLLDLPRGGDRRGAVDGTRPAPAALRLRAAAVLHPRARHRGRRPAHVREVRDGRHPLGAARPRLAVGPLAQGSEQPGSTRAERLPARYDLSLPGNQRKLDAVEQLAQLTDEAGITLIQMAIAFVLNHPAVTAPIIGPRTMEHLESQLAAADVVLDAALLDRIDEIVPPGTTINPADAGWTNPALEIGARRR